jgi:hypothetical protein
MVLALVMTASLAVVGAGAAGSDFKDGDAITYKEAVDVIGTLGVVDGYEDESFKPDAELTRGAAAKIICNMILGPTTAKALPATVAPFPDVPVGHTFAGYIAYCSEQNIISGYTDGLFRPAGNLTGYAFMKMLLGALGYDQNIESYVGNNWAINVAKQAIGIGLDKGLVDGFDGSKIVTRQEAALYTFNTLQADLVNYPDENGYIEVNGAVISLGTHMHKAIEALNSNDRNGHIKGVNKDLYIQFAEQYFGDLIQLTYDQNGQTDGFGRPATKWTWKGSNIGTYALKADKSYVGDVKLDAIYADLNMSTKADSAKKVATKDKYQVTLFVNGTQLDNAEDFEDEDGNVFDFSVSRTNENKVGKATKAAGQDKVGNGTLIDVFHDDEDNSVTICVISVYGGKVTQIKEASKGKRDRVVIEYDDEHCPGTIAQTGKDEFETNGFEEEDIVWYTYSDSDKEIKSMEKIPTPKEGTLTRVQYTKDIQLGSDTYKFAKEVAYEGSITNREADLENGNEYRVYLDPNGFALWIEEAEYNVDAYALLEKISVELRDKDGTTIHIGWDGYQPVSDAKDGNGLSIWDGNRARLLFSDGTERNVELDNNKYYTLAEGWDAKGIESGNIIVRYKTNSKGQYKLTAVETLSAYQNFKLDDKTMTGFEKDVDGDSKTVFVVYDDGDYKVYTGLKNAPSIAKAAGDGTAYAYTGKNGNIAKIVFITAGKVQSSSNDIVFVAAASASKVYWQTDGTEYYVYNAVVKGEIETIRIEAETVLTNGVLGVTMAAGEEDDYDQEVEGIYDIDAIHSIVINDVEEDSDDIITMGTWDDEDNDIKVFQDWGVRRVSDTEITIGTNSKMSNSGTKDVAKNAQVFFVNGDGDIEEIKVADIKSNKDAIVYYVTDEGEITQMFIIDPEA